MGGIIWNKAELAKNTCVPPLQKPKQTGVCVYFGRDHACEDKGCSVDTPYLWQDERDKQHQSQSSYHEHIEMEIAGKGLVWSKSLFLLFP